MSVRLFRALVITFHYNFLATFNIIPLNIMGYHCTRRYNECLSRITFLKWWSAQTPSDNLLVKEENGRSGLVYTRGRLREQITTPIFTTLIKYLNHKRRPSYRALFNDNPREVVHHGYDFINMPRPNPAAHRILIMALHTDHSLARSCYLL